MTVLTERRPVVTKSYKSEILYFARATLGDDVPELESATTSEQAMEIVRSRLEAEPETSKLYPRLKHVIDTYDK